MHRENERVERMGSVQGPIIKQVHCFETKFVVSFSIHRFHLLTTVPTTITFEIYLTPAPRLVIFLCTATLRKPDGLSPSWVGLSREVNSPPIVDLLRSLCPNRSSYLRKIQQNRTISANSYIGYRLFFFFFLSLRSKMVGASLVGCHFRVTTDLPWVRRSSSVISIAQFFFPCSIQCKYAWTDR